MESIRTQNFSRNPEAAFWAVSPAFSVQGEPCWEDEKISLFPVCTDWEDRCFPEAAVTLSLTALWSEGAASAGTHWTLEAWNPGGESDLILTGDRTLLSGCLITVAGMIAERRNHFRCVYQEIRPARNAAKALPTGRAICLSHQQLNL